MAKRIVHMLNSMGMGGVENFLMNVYRNIDREKYQFDFILQSDQKSYFEDEIEKLGGKIYKIPRVEKHPIKHTKELYKILKGGNYIAFHRHTASSVVFLDLLVAKKSRITRRIVHSHNTSHEQKILNAIFRRKLYNTATHHLACTRNAGKWLYGKQKFEIFNNVIDCAKYEFREETRKKYREEFGIDETTVAICHIGRFDKQKNHKYLLKIFAKLCQKNLNYKLFLCGDGMLRPEIIKFCEEKNIMGQVVFLGIRSDVNNVLQAMDIFVFPSLYEGLGIVLIEAQMTNIPSIVSDTIPNEAIYNTNVIQLGIDDSDIDEWCEKITSLKIDNLSRKIVNTELIKDYDVASVTNKLVNMYDGKENYETFDNNSNI